MDLDLMSDAELFVAAGRVLSDAKLKGVALKTRQQALAVINGIRPAPMRRPIQTMNLDNLYRKAIESLVEG